MYRALKKALNSDIERLVLKPRENPRRKIFHMRRVHRLYKPKLRRPEQMSMSLTDLNREIEAKEQKYIDQMNRFSVTLKPKPSDSQNYYETKESDSKD